MNAKALLITLLTVAISLTSRAAKKAGERKGFFWGAGLGAGYLDRSFNSTDAVDDAAGRFYMDFFGGAAINPHIAIGLELSGWTITPDSDTYIWNPYWPPDQQRSENPQGEGLMQILAFTRLYPYEDKGLFLKLGGGAMEHWLKTDFGNYSENGWTTVAGLGWDVHVTGNWSIIPTLSYSYGIAGSQTHRAVTASIGFMWHGWKGPDRFSKMDPAGLYNGAGLKTDIAYAQPRCAPFILNAETDFQDIVESRADLPW